MRKDFRSLSHDALEVIRIQSVKMVVHSKMSNREVCQIMDILPEVLSKWLGMYWKGSWKALKSKKNKGGRPKDPSKNLTPTQMKKLGELLLNEPRNVQQLKIDLSLWTAALVGELISKIFFKRLKVLQITKILKDLGFTYQKPIFRAYQQDLLKVQAWRDARLPAIELEARLEGREILYGDEAGFRFTEHRGHTWGTKGKTPIVKATGARFGINAVSAISKNGVLRFMAYEGSFTSDTLLVFLERLAKKPEEKFTLILDGHPTHKTKKVETYLASINHRIKLYYLPPYSPELNPDEQVWNHVKNAMKGRFSACIHHLKKHVLACLNSLQKQPSLIQSFFRHPEVVGNYSMLARG